MKIRLILILVIGTALLACSVAVSQEHSAGQTAQAAMQRVRSMDIVGEIAKADQGYIIRGKKPAEIFTILNPDPAVLDAFVKTGRTVRIMVHVVSGDNIEIKTIDGSAYGPGGQTEKAPSSAP